MNRQKFLIFCFPLGRVGQGATETFAGLRSLGGSCISTNSRHVFSTLRWFVLKCPYPPALDCKPHRRLMSVFAPRGQEALCGHVK